MNSQKIIVGPVGSGLQTNVPPFYVDNDSFPVLINAYQWRGRVRRKRGTSLLGRLQRFFTSKSTIYSATSTITLNGSGVGNVLSGFGITSNAPNASLVAGTGVFVATGPQTYRDLFGNGFLTPGGTGGPNFINYNTGQITIPAEAGNTINATFLYNPNLPVMGLEDLILTPTVGPGTLAFDTKYSYNILQTYPYSIYDVTFYKNPPTSGTYTQKTNPTPFTWNGQNYQQFWTTNAQNALWATNGVTVPFNPSNIGMQFALPTVIARTSATTVNFTIIGNPLVVGDFVFVNEINGTTPADAQTINFQSGYVTAAGNIFTVTFPNASINASAYTGGMVQYLTNVSNPAQDCLRWYDGDPTDGNPTTPSFVNGNGWVNYMPPLSRASFSIADLPPAQYYLVGARLITSFKDRMIFMGPVVQTSSGAPIYLPDTVIYSENGTPYYTASFTGDPSLASTVFTPILVPVNQSAIAPAMWEDQTGFGGNIPLGIDQPILSAVPNEDVFILGSPAGQIRLVYSGSDIIPFNFYFIDNELDTSSTFSAVNLGLGVYSRGNRGITLASQREVVRVDVPILDQNMQINLVGNGAERITAQRDYVNEWIYLTYKSNKNNYTFPTQTLQYNYRDKSWAIFNESYTTYGEFRKQTGFTWATLPPDFQMWKTWNEPWNSGASTLLVPDVIVGNQQGFVFFRVSGTSEANSLYIQSIAAGGVLTIPDHCLNEGDYIVLSSCNGITGLNGNIYSVASPTTNTIILNPVPTTTGTYLGGGLVQRMYVPFIQTKQFPTAWGIGRKTRIGVQRYLFSTTPNGQVQLLIFLSQDGSNPYNIPPLDADITTPLIYSTTLQTCYEVGFGIFNNSQLMISGGGTSSPQSQIWHRMNTSLIGDTVQIGITLSDKQMRDVDFESQFSEIELFGFILDTYPSQMLC